MPALNGVPGKDHRGDREDPTWTACRARIIVEIAKTPLGRARVANASERLDRTVADMREKHRVNVSQGEKLADGVQRPEAVGANVLPQLVPLPPESRVVVPPAEKAGQGETRVREVGGDVDRGFEGLGETLEEEQAPACPEGQDLPSMEVDTIEKAEADLRE